MRLVNSPFVRDLGPISSIVDTRPNTFQEHRVVGCVQQKKLSKRFALIGLYF